MEQKLAKVFLLIEKNETNYAEREILVYKALYIAKQLGYEAGIRYDNSLDDSANWPVCCIYLPDIGEISWHCPAYKRGYSDYSNDEKYSRTNKYVGLYLLVCGTIKY